MGKVSVFTFFLVFGYGPILGADQIPPILKKLASFTTPVEVYTYFNSYFVGLDDLPVNFRDAGCAVIKTSKQVYALPQGTGRVYRLDSTQNRFFWQRIDRTFYTGYNFGFFAFQRNDTLYSFGGHGFWHTNGNLRYFNQKTGEWNVIKLDREIPWSDINAINAAEFISYDSSHASMTVKAQGIKSDHALKEKEDNFQKTDLFTLDLVSGNWKRLGHFGDTGFIRNATTPWGYLVDWEHLVDIRNNRYMKANPALSNAIMSKVTFSTGNHNWVMSFCVDSTFYFGNMTDPYDSVNMSANQWLDTNIPVYEEPEKVADPGNFDLLSFASGGVTMAIFFASVLFFKRKKKSYPSTNVAEPELPPTPADSDEAVAPPEKHVSFRSSKLLDLLETKERSLLKFIHDHSLEERFTTIDEINRVIGVSSRSTEVQKRMRSDLIGSINDKLGLISKNKKPVIDKQRSEFDKRTFEYFIRPEHMELVGKVIHGK